MNAKKTGIVKIWDFIWVAGLVGGLFLASCASEPQEIEGKKIVLLAGKKSHGPGDHEYIKSARLLKVMLDNANLGLTTEVHYNGWPEDEATLEDADLILTISDGRDGHLFSPVPFMSEDRMRVMQKQMDRGCGIGLVHFSTFASDHFGDRVLDWAGGYFDWQGDDGERKWYSAIETLDSNVEMVASEHEISNGMPASFELRDEFYYKIRFVPNDPRLSPILAVPELNNDQALGSVVAWALDREDGGRGFSTTTGHFYSNWQNDNYRKLILNGIIWATGMQVPEQGVNTKFYDDDAVTQALFGKSKKALILTGNHHPAHVWQETTPVLKQALELDPELQVDVSTDIEDLNYYDLKDYDFLVMNYCNWEDSTGLSDKGKDAFTNYLTEGGGLVLVHFANGAFHSSLPGASSSDWPEYRAICRRVWDHNKESAHDKYGKFTVSPSEIQHAITEGFGAFETEDELYYNQEGDLPIEPLLTARSKDTGRDEPLAWAYSYGNGRVFQTVLGHDVTSLSTPEVQRLLNRGAMWSMGKLD